MKRFIVSLCVAFCCSCSWFYGDDFETGLKEVPELVEQSASIRPGRLFEDGHFEKRSAEMRKEYEQKQREAEQGDIERREKIEEIREKLKAQRGKKQVQRRVKRWSWKSPAEQIASVWSVPVEESTEAIVTGLLRICTSEQEGSRDDCIGIWQVLSNIRSRSCNRQYINLITECDKNGETMLSTMRRASRYVLGVAAPRAKRQQWISNLEQSCDKPRGFPYDDRIWERRHRKHCEETLQLAKELVGGRKLTITGARVIAWGGRCEVSKGACDDQIACLRGLARVPLETANAFWCRPGSLYCATEVDPICHEMMKNESFAREYNVIKKAQEIRREQLAKLRRKKQREEQKERAAQIEKSVSGSIEAVNFDGFLEKLSSVGTNG